jgi:AraC family transcriptional regulator
MDSKSEHGKHSLLARLQRVNRFIHEHAHAESPDVALDTLSLAELAHLSPYHGHRLYASAFGESMAATVKRIRLHHAAAELARGRGSVQEVAQRAGYPSVPSFTRTFAQAFGMPPALYRERGVHAQFQLMIKEGVMSDAYPVRFGQTDRIELLGVEHTGAYMRISQAFDALYGGLAMHGVSGEGMRCVALYFDDPFAVPQDQLRSLACVVPSDAARRVAASLGLKAYTIEACECAILRYQGPYASMHSAYEWLFGHWLPQSGREPWSQPPFEDYLNSPRDTPAAQLLTDIYVPLKDL